jgi:sulfotransferase
MRIAVSEKTIYLVGGLQRSGSTLLMNILGQNPRFHVTPTSGIAQLLAATRSHWKNNESFRAMVDERKEEIQRNVMRGIFFGWFHHVEKPVCIDKYHLWPEHLETVAAVLGGKEKVKLLVPVRDLRDILASFEKLHRRTTALNMSNQEWANLPDFNTAIGRVKVFIDKAQPLGRAFNAIRDAVTRGWRDNMYFVEFDRLTRTPDQVLKEIYAFLGEDFFQHDFRNVKQITRENDEIYGFKDLHNIRNSVEPVSPQWHDVFDQVVTQEPEWKDLEKVAQFWKACLSPPKRLP